MMSDSVQWALDVTIKDGQLGPLKDLMIELVDRTQSTEPGTLCYEWSISEDKSSCHIYERYADSPSAMKHLATFGENYADRFMSLVEPTGFVVFGNPSDEVKQAVAGFNPTYMGRFGGFAR